MPVRLLVFSKVANFCYFTDTSGTIYHLYIHVLNIHCCLPLSTVIHTLMVSGDPQQDEDPRGLGGIGALASVCLKEN